MIAFSMVVVYLLLTLLLAFVARRRELGHVRTVRSFFVANGKMPLFAVTTMLFADLIAASTTTGTAGTGYTTGYAALWGIWGSSMGCIVFSKCFCRFFFEMRDTGAITEPEAFGIRFSQKIRYLVFAFTIIPLFIILSTQVAAASMYMGSMLGLDETVATVVVFALFLAMALPGINGIAEMNKMHAFVIFFGISFAALVCLNHVGGPGALAEKLPESYFNPFTPGVPTVIAQFVGGALGFAISTTSVNIGYCAKDMKTAERSHFIVAGVSALFAFAPATVGLCAAVSLEGIRPDNSLYLMTNAISPELAGLTVMGVFAAIFSTAPWFTVAIAKLTLQELFVPIQKARGKKVTDRHALVVTRGVIVAALVIAVAISGTNASFLNSLMSASQIKSIAVILLLFGIYWKRTSNAAGFAGLLVGGTLSTLWYVLGSPFGVQPFWPGMVSSITIIVLGSLLAGDRGLRDYAAYRERLAAGKRAFAADRGYDQGVVLEGEASSDAALGDEAVPGRESRERID